MRAEEKAVEEKIRIMDLDASLVAYPFYRTPRISNTGRRSNSGKKWAKFKILQNGEKLKD